MILGESVSQKQYLWTIWILQSFLAMNASHRTLNPSPGSRLQQRLQLQWPPLYRGDSSGRYSLLMDKDSAPIDDRDSSFSLFWLMHIRLCDGMLVKPRTVSIECIHLCIFIYYMWERELRRNLLTVPFALASYIMSTDWPTARSCLPSSRLNHCMQLFCIPWDWSVPQTALFTDPLLCLVVL